jgi:transcription initiation factor IIE alpha subunit
MNDVTSGEFSCPRCGYVIDASGSGDDSDAVIESQRQEISHLRETIAYLRGSLGRAPIPER